MTNEEPPIIAIRDLRVAEGGTVATVILRTPQPDDEGEWECRFTISGLANPVSQSAYGIDAMQALILAIESIRAWVLSHELQHEEQNQRAGGNRRGFWASTSLQTLPASGGMAGMAGQLGRSFQAGLELEADRRACQNATGIVLFLPRC